MQPRPSLLSRPIAFLLIFGGLAAACGRSDLVGEPGAGGGGGQPGQDGGPDVIVLPDGRVIDSPPGDSAGSEVGPDGSSGSDTKPPAHCGDGACDDGESCATCPMDCGLCSSCGDGKCDSGAGETCKNCPQDCGLCTHCPDGVCDDGETCISCAPDCGACPSCGDGKCDAMAGEDCFTCPADCGKCMGCGDGLCSAPGETCASCPADCGVCSFCGNGKCEMDETCSNCPLDCGMCPAETSLGLVTCSISCISTLPPDLVCLDKCLAGACMNALYAANAVITCATMAFMDGTCMGFDLGCIMTACPSQIATCETISCTEM